MKMIILESKYVVGFANSIAEFLELNSKRKSPYGYKEQDLTSLEITPDVFGLARIEGMSNFADYPGLATKEIKEQA